MYDVQITSLDGSTSSKVMTWKQVRRYLPGGSLAGTVKTVSLHRIVKGA